MTVDITNPIFHDETKARVFLELQRWPNGPVCPYCKETKNVVRMGGDAGAKGQVLCRPCRKKFTVTVGTVMERSHITLAKWVLAFRLMASSKKGMSAHQMHRMMGITYKTAWFLAHRVREAMRMEPESEGPLGGEGKTVESDEAFVGGKAKNVHNGKPVPPKAPVVALVERGGKLRAKVVANVTAKTVREVLAAHVDPKTELHTDDSLVYYWIGQEYAMHRAVNHSKSEYVSKDGQAYVNTAESFFAILKRAMYGTHHAVSEKHLQRYVEETMFKWNHRSSQGIEDAARTIASIKRAEGKRLTYRRTNEAH